MELKASKPKFLKLIKVSNNILFVENINRETTKKYLEDVFSKYGSLVSCTLKTTYAFIQYEDFRDLEDALDGKHFQNNTSKYKFPLLFVGNLHRKMTADDLVEILNQYIEVQSCKLRSRYALIGCENGSDCKHAFESLNGQRLDGKKLTVMIFSQK